MIDLLKSGAAVLLLTLAVPSVGHAKCSDPPRPRVNWQDCNKENVHLTRENLEGANLQGTNLKGSWLMGANLLNANLTGADLTDANLQGANLSCVIVSGATFSRAKWNTGRMCDAVSSAGLCKIVYADWELSWVYHKNEPVYYPVPASNDHCRANRPGK